MDYDKEYKTWIQHFEWDRFPTNGDELHADAMEPLSIRSEVLSLAQSFVPTFFKPDPFFEPALPALPGDQVQPPGRGRLGVNPFKRGRSSTSRHTMSATAPIAVKTLAVPFAWMEITMNGELQVQKYGKTSLTMTSPLMHFL